MEHLRAVFIQVEAVHQENHQVQQVLLSIHKPNQLLQAVNQQALHQRNQIPQVLQRAVQKRRIIIIHMMMDMKQFMMMEIMMITDMTGIQTTQMELMMQWMNWDGKIVVWRYGLFMYISCKMMS